MMHGFHLRIDGEVDDQRSTHDGWISPPARIESQTILSSLRLHGGKTMAYEYDLLKVQVDDRIATITVDNPPINLITMPLYAELRSLSEALEQDPDLSVVVLKSADPDFFLAHFDVATILEFPVEGVATRSPAANPYHVMCERFRTMDKITIAQIEGRVGGGGGFLKAKLTRTDIGNRCRHG